MKKSKIGNEIGKNYCENIEEGLEQGWWDTATESDGYPWENLSDEDVISNITNDFDEDDIDDIMQIARDEFNTYFSEAIDEINKELEGELLRWEWYDNTNGGGKWVCKFIVPETRETLETWNNFGPHCLGESDYNFRSQEKFEYHGDIYYVENGYQAHPTMTCSSRSVYQIDCDEFGI